MELNDKWVLWEHPVDSGDWSLSGYNRLYEITDAESFWSITNNIQDIGIEVTNLYLMKDGVTPTWEDPANRHGGTCSFKVDIGDVGRFWEMLTLHMVTGMVTEKGKDDHDITGMSISPKISGRNSWGIIKVWNETGDIDISRHLNKNILDECNGISIKYKKTEPER